LWLDPLEYYTTPNTLSDLNYDVNDVRDELKEEAWENGKWQEVGALQPWEYFIISSS
jgi:hypothetical protein